MSLGFFQGFFIRVQVLQIIVWPVKGKKPVNTSVKKIFEKHSWICVKPQNFAVYTHEGKQNQILPEKIFGYDHTCAKLVVVSICA